MKKLERQLCDLARLWGRGQRAIPHEALRFLAGIFADLSATRSVGPAGPDPISYREIAAYCALMNTPLRPDHIAALRAMDEAWCSEVCKRGDQDKDILPPLSGPTLSAALLDVAQGKTGSGV